MPLSFSNKEGIGYDVRISPTYEDWRRRFINSIDKTLNSDDSWGPLFGPFIYDPEDPDVIYMLASTTEIEKARRDKARETDIYGNPVNLSVTFYEREPIEVMIDATNFINGVPISKLGKKEYRKYLINHETGHVLGYGHLPCMIENESCPLMYQMTKGVPSNFMPNYKVSSLDYEKAPLLSEKRKK